MKEFIYVIKDEIGLHARPAGLLAKKAAEFKCTVTISNGTKSVDAKRILGILQLAVKSNQKVVITVNGEDEELALQEIKKFMNENV